MEMQWLYISIVAYLLLGIANLGDKLVVTKYLSSPKIYAISVALLQSVAVLLLPFFWNFPGWSEMGLNFLTGASFVLAIYFLYTALKTGETSGVVPSIDISVPIIILIVSTVFMSQDLNSQQIQSLLFLIIGGILLAWSNKKQNTKVIKYIFLSAIFFSISQMLADIIYAHQGFMSAFAWSRLGAVVSVLPFLLISKTRKELKDNFKGEEKTSSSKAVGITQLSGGIAVFLQNYAISLGSVTVIAALQGVKYVFIFILIALFSKKFVQIKEDWSGFILVRKLGGIVLVLVGLAILVI